MKKGCSTKAMKRKQDKAYKYPELIKLTDQYVNDKEFEYGTKILFANIEDGIIEKEKYIEDGDKVKLNIASITSHPSWGKMQQTYKNFVLSHPEEVFTVEYIPKFGARPSIISLREDNSDPKFYFCTQDLIPIAE